jgi:hypothetical protein
MFVAMFALISLGLSGEHDAGIVGSQHIRREGRVGTLTERIFKPQPAVSVPMLWGVQWTDTGLAGVSIKVQADAVSRRSRRIGALTFKSFQEIVATKVRVRVVDQLRAGDRDRKTYHISQALGRLQERLVGFYVMARGGLHSKPDPANVFTHTFLSGVVFEDLALEVVRGGVVGRLRIETMSIATEGPGWNLHGIQVEAIDGRRLSIREAKWIRNDQLVAYGPYALEENQERASGPRGCFLIRLTDVVEIHGPIQEDADAALCAPNLFLIQSPPELPAAAMPFPKGGGVWPNKQSFRFVKKLPFLVLPTIPVLDVRRAADVPQEY